MHQSGELNDSTVDEFITGTSALAGRKSGRPRSSYQTFRDSSNFVAENKYGVSRRLIEADDDGPVESIKLRQSMAIDKLGTFATCASIFKTFVGLGILGQPY